MVASGEQVTAGLLAMTLRNMGFRRVPGWAGRCRSSPTRRTAARASRRSRRTKLLGRASDGGEIAVIAGFQGVTRDGPHFDPRPRRLGHQRGGHRRGGGRDRCDIYTDVDGVYTTDPRIEAKARRLAQISYEEMLEMASLGAKVLQTRSVEMAMAARRAGAGAVEFRRAGRRAPSRAPSCATRRRSWKSAS